MHSQVAESLDLGILRYSQVWEDHRLLEKGLQIQPTDDVLSICAAGCNVLAILLQEPRSVTAIDMSPAQTALLELKLGAIKHTSYDEFLALLGYQESKQRLTIYDRLRGLISKSARDFWDQHAQILEHGVSQAGKLEKYFRGFSQIELPKVCEPNTIDALLASPDLPTQRKRFARLDTLAFEAKFKWYYSQERMQTGGRDPAQYRQVQGVDSGDYFYERLRYTCNHLLLKDNFYMQAFLSGGYRDLRRAQPYLHPLAFKRLKSLVDRVRVVTDELERFVQAQTPSAFSKANLSDIFEYMSREAADKMLGLLAKRMRSGGRIAYWNLLVERSRPAHLADQLHPIQGLADQLWKNDRSWFYRAFRLEEVV